MRDRISLLLRSFCRLFSRNNLTLRVISAAGFSTAGQGNFTHLLYYKFKWEELLNATDLPTSRLAGTRRQYSALIR